jgi:hypothetical protein
LGGNPSREESVQTKREGREKKGKKQKNRVMRRDELN